MEHNKEADTMDPSRHEIVSADSEHEAAVGGEGMSRAKWLACLALLILETAALEPIVLSSVAKKVDDELGPVSYYNWMMISFSITLAVVNPISGGLSDIFGRKTFLLGGCAIMAVGFVIGLTAKGIPQMIASLIVQAMGAGSMQLAYAAIAEIVPKKDRGVAQSILELATLPWTVFGNLIGMLMIKHTSLGYKGLLVLGLVLDAFAAVFLFFFYKPPIKPLPCGRSKLQELGRIDWIGIILYAATFVLILVALSLGGVDVPYKHPKFYMTLISGILALIMLIVWEWKLAKHPFFAHSLFKGPGGRKIPLFFAVIFVTGGTLYSSAALWPQQLQGVYYEDADKIGLASLTNGGGLAVGGLFGGMLLGRAWFLDARYMLGFSCIIKIIADIFSSRCTPNTPALALGMGFLGSFFVGLITLVCVTAVQLLCDEANLGLASLLQASLRSAGGSVSIAVFSNFLQDTLKKRIIGEVLPALKPYISTIKDLQDFMTKMGTGQVDKARALPGIDPRAVELVRERLKWIYMAGFKKIYTAAIGWGVVALILCLFVANVKPFMTNEVAVHLTNDLTVPHQKDIQEKTENVDSHRSEVV